LCGDIAKECKWAGKSWTADQWKVLLISGHAVATKQGAEVVPGIEGEFVNMRESTARMTKARATSLIDYAMAFYEQIDPVLPLPLQSLALQGICSGLSLAFAKCHTPIHG